MIYPTDRKTHLKDEFVIKGDKVQYGVDFAYNTLNFTNKGESWLGEDCSSYFVGFNIKGGYITAWVRK